MDGYAVVDVETTGLFPRKHDRIVEIAVVEVSGDGRITDEWCTLLNPDRDLGPQQLHGIRAADVMDAPTFPEVAGDVAERLIGRIFTAHNALFDALFLAAEFDRAGITVPIKRESTLCTMRLAGRYLPGAARSLAGCCQAAGIALLDAHSALGDARAASALLRTFLSMEAPPPPWLNLVDCTRAEHWPHDMPEPRHCIPVQRGSAEQETDGKWVNRLVTTLPRVPDPPTADGYLDVLDRALLDRELSRTEKADLVALAEQMGLSRSDLLELHRSYLDALAVAAWADGKVTAEERTDLAKVALLLGLNDQSVEQSLETVGRDPLRGGSGKVRHNFVLEPGDRVVFTGNMVRPRDEWIRLVENAGLVTGGVTKFTKLVVVADIDSMSGKAKKARDYGVAVVGESVFTKLFNQYLTVHTLRSGSEARI